MNGIKPMLTSHPSPSDANGANPCSRGWGPVTTMREPQPLHHATLVCRVHGMPKGWAARILFLLREDGVSEPYAPLVEYMKAFQSRSSTWQDNVARALGLLWDFTRVRGDEIDKQAEREGRFFINLHFRAFATALIHGTVQDGDDPTGLFWPRTSLSRARTLVRAIEAFSDWRIEEGHSKGPSNAEEVRLGFTDMLVWSRVSNVSFLKHLSTPKQVRVRSSVDLGRQVGLGTEPVKFFPPEHVERLLLEGHVRPRRRGQGHQAGESNLRDQMMVLLDGWGGLRRSEGLHLWVQDVVKHPNHPGQALVFLHHPSEAQVGFWDAASRRMRKRTRQEELANLYGLRPRHLEMTGGYHAGWKGIALDASLSEIVYWRDEKAATLFWDLYVAYVRTVRPRIMDRRRDAGGRDHPFLFVSEGRGDADGRGLGAPYSPQAYERNHAAAVRRIGLVHSKEAGTTTHGLRHLYGQTISSWGISAAVIRKCMRHVSFLSQAVYVAPTRDAVNEVLRSAVDGSLDPVRRDALLGGSETAQALYHLNEQINGRMPA